MNRNFILKADILDIIFEKRNKEYGAYDLRKFYPNRLKLALGGIFVIAIAFSAFTSMPPKKQLMITGHYEIPDPKFKNVHEQEKPKEEPKKQPEQAKPERKPVQQPIAEKQHTNNITIVDKTIKADSIVTLLPDDKTGTTTVVTPTKGPFLVTPEKTEPGTGTTGTSAPKPGITTPLDGDAVDVLPTYPGGMDALRKFLEKNLNTPDELQSGETVSVRVKFVVGYNGKLQSFVTVQDGGDAYNKEVVRVLKKMPDWIPGKARGENVPVYYTIPVKFISTE